MEWKWSLWMTLAFLSTFGATLLSCIAFATSYWLQTDPLWPVDRISRLGLWEICFDFYTDPHHFFGHYFDGCLLFSDDRLFRLRPQLLPAFFVATQVLYCLSFVLLVLAGLLLLTMTFKRSWRFPVVFVAMVIVTLSAIFGLLAVAVFGSLSKTFVWVTDRQLVHVSWSYWLAVTAFILEVLTAVFLTMHLVLAVRNDSPAVSITSDEEFLKGSKM